MRALAMLWIAFWACSCHPAVSPVVDAGDGGRSPCATDELITQDHLIRGPDGKWVSIPCVDAGP